MPSTSGRRARARLASASFIGTQCDDVLMETRGSNSPAWLVFRRSERAPDWEAPP
jgi:hypothetical protein